MVFSRSINLFTQVCYPTEEFIQLLRLDRHCQVFELEEKYIASQRSFHLPQRKSVITDQRSFTRQYLIHADKTLQVSGVCGLLRWRSNSLIYEANTENHNYLYETGANFIPIWQHILRRITHIKSGRLQLAPGWYHYSRPKFLNEKHITLVGTHNNPNYFHWFTLPGQSPVFMESQFKKSEIDMPPIVITSSSAHPVPPYVKSIFEITAPNRKLIFDESIRSSDKTNFALQHLQTPIGVSPKMIIWLNQKVKQALGYSESPRELIYVARGNTKSKMCLNESEIFHYLESLGFKYYCLESMPVLDQLQLFRRARCIISPHGAALTNLIACHPQTNIIELMPAKGNTSHYFIISDILKLNHSHIVGKSVSLKTNSYIIDLADILEMLRRILGF